MNNKKSIFTISSFNYLHYALNVRNSFLKYNDNYDFIIFLMDSISDRNTCSLLKNMAKDGIHIMSFLELKNCIDFYPIEEMVLKYNILEMNTAIKPFCIEYLFRCNYEKVIYIDPDIQFFSSISKLDTLLDTYDVVLTPHMMHPYPDDGKTQNCQIIMHAGMNNCGFFAATKSAEGYKAVKFWEQQLKDKCYVDTSNALFTDQRWSDWFPYICNNIYILKDYGYNAAYWNLHERVISKKSGKWFSNNDELVFYHFSGLSRKDKNLISKYQNRYKLEDREKDLEELFDLYLDSVSTYNADMFSSIKYYYSKVQNTDYIISESKRRRCYSGHKLFITNQYEAQDSIKKYGDNSSLFYYQPGFGVNIIGYVEECHSIGEVARNFIDRLLGTSIPFSIFCIESGAKQIEDSEMNKYKPFITQTPCFPINIICINADQLPIVMKKYESIFHNKYNIANFWWEYETGFGKFADACKLVDKVIVFSTHVRNAISKYIDNKDKIEKIAYPLQLQMPELDSVDMTRDKYSISKDKFVLFFNFDYNSSFIRKNPIAILEAFALAFHENPDVILVIKTSNSGNFIEKKRLLEDKIKHLNLENNVIIIDSFLTKKEMLSLINSCDAYISLHRAEGLGLGMCEAMLLKKAVIASNYSGNIDFMNVDNSFLVNTNIVKCHENDNDTYDQVTQYGDPDIQEAAQYMKNIYINRESGKTIGEKAYNSIINTFSENKFKIDIYKLLLDIPEDRIFSKKIRLSKGNDIPSMIFFYTKMILGKALKNIHKEIKNRKFYSFLKNKVRDTPILYKIYLYIKNK